MLQLSRCFMRGVIESSQICRIQYNLNYAKIKIYKGYKTTNVSTLKYGKYKKEQKDSLTKISQQNTHDNFF